MRLGTDAAGVDTSLAIWQNSQTMTVIPALDVADTARLKARAEVMKALGHPTRLFVVEELARGERCVCELQQMIGADVSTVSKHLSVLKNAGLVVDDKRGTQVFYALRVPCVLNFFGCVEAIIAEAGDPAAAVVRQPDVARERTTS